MGVDAGSQSSNAESASDGTAAATGTAQPQEAHADGEPPLFDPRWNRRMTRTHAVMWIIILTSTVLDILLTITGLQFGFQEGNVVVRSMMDSFGLLGLFGVKLAAMGWLVAGWSLLSDRNAAIFLGLFASVTVAVVLHNYVTLFGL